MSGLTGGSDLALMGLLQLNSPGLPVGTFSDSQGLESAVEDGLIKDAEAAQDWIRQRLEIVIGRCDAPLWLRLYGAFRARDWATATSWNEDYMASRETAELEAEARQMGQSASRWLNDLDLPLPEQITPPTFIAAHTWACANWNIPPDAGLPAYLFTWAENQVMAALKLVPLEQPVGQRLLLELQPKIGEIAIAAATLGDEDLSTGRHRQP